MPHRSSHSARWAQNAVTLQSINNAVSLLMDILVALILHARTTAVQTLLQNVACNCLVMLALLLTKTQCLVAFTSYWCVRAWSDCQRCAFAGSQHQASPQRACFCVSAQHWTLLQPSLLSLPRRKLPNENRDDGPAHSRALHQSPEAV